MRHLCDANFAYSAIGRARFASAFHACRPYSRSRERMTILGGFWWLVCLRTCFSMGQPRQTRSLGTLAKSGYSLREDGHDIDAMSGVELMGFQSNAFEALLQLSLGSGESDSD